MKTFLALLLFLFPVLPAADVADEVAVAVRSGDAKALSKYFADNVDLKVLEQENIYSKAQAEMILRDFFARHAVQEFSIIRKSLPNNDSQFVTGSLKTSNGTFRVHYLLKSSTVTQFRIETSDE
ncbi:MAG TPA: DUF4783 domain-containing protein [Bacteroidia bacterium]|nr:DUF4783 domain-containing protein [Bacteroidia bacterium]